MFHGQLIIKYQKPDGMLFDQVSGWLIRKQNTRFVGELDKRQRVVVLLPKVRQDGD